MPDDACRIDVWLWRARLFKTRAMAARVVESGRVRLTRGGLHGRVDKPSRGVKIGDEIVFALAGRLIAVRVAGLGVRRGPPAEARALFQALEASEGRDDAAAIDKSCSGLAKGAAGP